MTALACLRILSNPERVVAGVETPTLIVRRIVATWLVAHWMRPRRFGEVIPGGFVLSDPDSNQVSPAALLSLAGELRYCAVSLALLNGGQADVTRFAALHAADLRAVLAGHMVVEGMKGELSAIAAHGVHRVEPSSTVTPFRLLMDDAALLQEAVRSAAAA